MYLWQSKNAHAQRTAAEASVSSQASSFAIRHYCGPPINVANRRNNAIGIPFSSRSLSNE